MTNFILKQFWGDGGNLPREGSDHAHCPCTYNATINLAMKLGAVFFLPKHELARINEHVAEILEDLAEGKTHWAKLFQKLKPLFKKRLGVEWKHLEKQSYPLTFD